MIIGLIGNQNAGKTTLFNALTGMNATIGNWPGVTIERKEGYIKGADHDLLLVDTPGVYSLSPYTEEEKVTRSFCLEQKPDLIINIVDATALERSLYLTTQLAELDTDVIVALNMTDILEKNGITIDEKKLSEELGLTVVRISAKTNQGIDTLIQTIQEKTYQRNPKRKIYRQDVQQEIDHLVQDVTSELEESENPRFVAAKLFEGDPYYKALGNSATTKEIEALEKTYDMDCEQIIADQRYQYVTSLTQHCETKKEMPVSLTDKIDRFVLNRFLALPLFILVMALMYFISVGIVGSLTADFIDVCFNGGEEIELFFHTVPFQVKGLGPLLGEAIINAGGSQAVADMLCNGIIAGISTILSFLPQLMVLFLCLSLLEASGYMSRIAFFLDRVFKFFGLSGKSIIPFIVGSGCSVPGIMTARTIDDRKEREMTIMLTPFIPCNAKLPIISLLAAVIFPSFGWLVSFLFYFLALIIVLVTALIFKKAFFRSGTATFISELPSYKMPNAYYVYRDVKDKTADFLERAGTTIFLCTVIVWFLTRFTWSLHYVGPSDFTDMMTANISSSMLADIGKVLAYLFIPAWGGHYSWGLTVSALQGMLAKEQVVSSLAVIAGGDILSSASPFAFLADGSTGAPLIAFSFIAFNLFSIPCISTVATMGRELGNKKKLLAALGLEILWSFVLSTIIGTVAWGLNGFGGAL